MLVNCQNSFIPVECVCVCAAELVVAVIEIVMRALCSVGGSTTKGWAVRQSGALLNLVASNIK